MKFYEFCYLEEGNYFINIEENHEIHKYILDDYVELINNNGFFAGFLEINVLSIILNRLILILETMEFDNYAFYKKLALFNKNSNEYFNINDIIFINFINRDHYQLLLPNFDFIKNRILNNTKIEYNIIKYNRKDNIIIDLAKENEIILMNSQNMLKKDSLQEENRKKNNIENSKFQSFNEDKCIDFKSKKPNNNNRLKQKDLSEKENSLLVQKKLILIIKRKEYILM